MQTADHPFSALHQEIASEVPPLRAAITAAWWRDEREAVQWLLAQASAIPLQATVDSLARELVQAVRGKRAHASGVDALMHEFSLSSEEGVALMCLAEALLRIPDQQTADRLIADKIGNGDWHRHLSGSSSLFVNAASWGLLITGKLVAANGERGFGAALTRLIAKGGEPLLRKGVDLAMRMLGRQFVAGRTITEALENSRADEKRGYRHSYDMLGEAALTAEDAGRYHAAYEQAIHAIGATAGGYGFRDRPGISVKLSALHPRYVRAQQRRVLNELLPRLKQLLLLAKRYDIGLNIDAEQADRLELSLDLMEALAHDPDLAGFDGIGFVAQAYQKRCPFVIDYLIDLAHRTRRRFMLRLVKGAYWDTEIKRAQVDGLPGYPVYTRKVYTDVSYLVCARKLLGCTDVIYPQFATHNAHTLAAVSAWAHECGVEDYEFQCLHGMGETLYDQVIGKERLDRPCRIYAPVGSHETLLPYLVRRLLENGANSSFVNQIVDDKIAIDTLVADPFVQARALGGEPHPRIALPPDLFGTQRRNSSGLDLNNEDSLRELDLALGRWADMQWQARPLLAVASDGNGLPRTISNPADRRDVVGHVVEAGDEQVDSALATANAYAMDWQIMPAAERAARLLRAADLFEANRPELMALAVREAGKTLANAVAEVREAVDFLRYYAMQIQGAPNALALGPVVCISPWNFPLAIFIGETAAALAAGNAVLAKPAEQTTLIAYRAVQLLHEAGIPPEALQLLPGRGETVGARLVADRRVHGVVFTGSIEVAQGINRVLAARAARESHEIVLIAETGGQNAMIVDSSALPEQVVQDVLVSAFDSAGQRCSALRVLCLQEEIADRTLLLLKGAMRELRIGNPDRLETDIGPVIDDAARQLLLRHIERMKVEAKGFYQLPLPPDCQHGSFIAPTLIEIASLSQLRREVFGPVLHVLRYRRDELPQLVDAINATGYGLTLGIHSRIEETISCIRERAKVGNIYVARNMIGAVVGVQPFGGEGKSGTGPKAGGPLYLMRLQRHVNVAPVLHAATLLHFEANRPLEDLLAWMRGNTHQRVAMLGEIYGHENLLKKSLRLPGPTGERDTLSFAPRGTVLCAATTEEALLNQMAAAFATGNRVLLTTEEASSLLPSDLPATVLATIDTTKAKELSRKEIHAALIDAALAPQWLPLLANRDGALVPVLETSGIEAIHCWRLVTERAVCVNTSAGGGNTELMTLAP